MMIRRDRLPRIDLTSRLRRSGLPHAVRSVLLLTAVGAGALGAQTPEVNVAPQRGPADAAELEAFLDGVMTAHLSDKHVAGATVAVVRDGRVLLAKGYGWADVDDRIPVDPERTMFRIGSVTKLFTWTAVMQLVEEGRIDLDQDVNGYLDFELPDTYDEPITMRHILSHTPGFEEDSRDLFTKDSTGIVPMGEWLADHIPARVRPPGEYSSYSNYATGLAGYIVERVSGMPYDDYIEQRILGPLGMNSTTARQPLPAHLAEDMSRGFKWSRGRFEEQSFEIITGAAPAGSISASASDMAKFMLAHLNHGAVGDRRILGAEAAALMHTRGFEHDPRLPGWALGFYEKSSHGVRIIGHGGDTQWFHSDLALIPEDGVGVFVSYNTDKGGELSFGTFLESFLDHYYPAQPTPVAIPDEAKAQARRVAGTYQFNRMSYTTWQKAAGLAAGVSIGAADDGTLLFAMAGEPMRMVPVGPLLYREELGHQLLAFQEDEDGDITHAFIGAAPMMAMERLAWFEAPKFHQMLLGLCALIFAATIIAAVRRFFRRRWGHRRPEDELPGRYLTVGISVLNVAFLVALGVLASDFWALLSPPYTDLQLALALPVLAALLTIGAIVMAVRHWRSGASTRGARITYSVVIAASLVFIWSLNTWNLLGWRF